jgi:hypothetical protein
MAVPSSISAAFRRNSFAMRTIWVIFVLALVAIASEIYSDAVLTSNQALPGAAEPAAVAVAHRAKPA